MLGEGDIGILCMRITLLFTKIFCKSIRALKISLLIKKNQHINKIHSDSQALKWCKALAGPRQGSSAWELRGQEKYVRSEREFCKWLWFLSELGKWLHGSCFEDQMKIFSEPLAPSASSLSSVAQVLTLPWCSCSEAQLSRTMEGINIRTSIYPWEPRYEVTHGKKASEPL